MTDREKLEAIAKVLYRSDSWISLPFGVKQMLSVVLEEIGVIKRGVREPEEAKTAPVPKAKRLPPTPWEP